jgi:hypothetical protein
MKEVMVVHTAGTVRQYEVDDVQAHPMVLMLLRGDTRIMLPWDKISSVEVKLNEPNSATEENSETPYS